MRLFPAIFALVPIAAMAQNPSISADAPADDPISTRAHQLAAFEAAIAPHIAEAKRTYPDAKSRFLTGLAPGESFFITTSLRDETGVFEQVFVAVRDIKQGIVTGRIWSDVRLVRGYHHGDAYSFPESELVDWLITHPDGSEEGNAVGKFLDTYTPPGGS